MRQTANMPLKRQMACPDAGERIYGYDHGALVRAFIRAMAYEFVWCERGRLSEPPADRIR